MQTVTMLAAKGATAAAALGRSGASKGGGGKTGASKSSNLLKGLRIGTSAISALTGYGQAKARAADLQAEAFGEELQSRQEYVQAQEKANAISRAYNATVEDQMAAAAAGGVGVSSGTIVAAREQAQAEADRQLGIIQNGAVMNASLRRARAASLRSAAKKSKSAGVMGGLTKLAEVGLQIAAAG